MSDSPSNIVILGGAPGVGGQCARAFVRAGWTCFIVDDDARSLEGLKEELGGKIDVYTGDLHTSLGLRNALAGAMAAFNRVDAVLHIPAIPEACTLLSGETSEFEERIVAPARSATGALKLFSRQMLEQKIEEEQEEDVASPPRANCFIQILSMTAVTGDVGGYAQSASQSLVLAATKAATLELAEHGLRTNAIIALRPRAEFEEEWLEARTPLGRACHADEIAQTALFLTTPAAANMTGQTITLDGGRSRLNGTMFECVRKEDR